MKYYVYKIEFESGASYIGCHIEKKKNDGYICSSVYQKKHPDDKIKNRKILVETQDRYSMGLLETICIMEDKAVSENNVNGTFGNYFLKYTNNWSHGNKGKPSFKRRKVICLETREIFDYVNKAEEKYRHCGAVCSGTRKTACGKHFKYLDEYDPNIDDIIHKDNLILCEEENYIYFSLEELARKLKMNPQTLNKSLPIINGKHYKLINEFNINDYNYDSSKETHYFGHIKCIENGAVFVNMKSAKKYTNISHIKEAIDGRRSTAGGFHWIMTNDPINEFSFEKIPYDHNTSLFQNHSIN